MQNTPELKWAKLPLQGRSEKTLARILDATERLLEHKAWSDIAIAEIVAEADSSVGAFYGRFKDKQALLYCLDERLLRETEATVAGLVADGRWRDLGLRESLAVLFGFFIEVFSRRKGLLRTLSLVPRLQPDDPQFRKTGRAFAKALGQLAPMLAQCAGEVAHPAPAAALKTTLAASVLLIRERVLFGSGPAQSLPAAKGALQDELVRMFAGYLQAD